jgi:hypothetical protein
VDDTALAVGEVATERDQRPHEERRDEAEVRRQAVHERIGLVGDEAFLEDQLQSVGEGLQRAVRAGLVGPDAVLQSGDRLALEPDDEDRRDERDGEHGEHLDRDDQELAPPQVARHE